AAVPCNRRDGTSPPAASVHSLEHPAVDRQLRPADPACFAEHLGPAAAEALAARGTARRAGVGQHADARRTAKRLHGRLPSSLVHEPRFSADPSPILPDPVNTDTGGADTGRPVYGLRGPAPNHP